VEKTEKKGLKSVDWRLSYKTSSTLINEQPVNILHDFYIPALRRSVRYDRVAGYFRSSSLAAASMGFSAFVGRKGRMRLIVGADLDPQDIKAILAGDSQRLAAELSKELNNPETWPQAVQHGVTLLAWMVAQGYLEVQVAFRLHRKSGEPLAFDSIEDGYVHEKWLLFYDEWNHRLYGTGSLNESKNALIRNAENIDIHCDWWGERERRRIDEAAEAFENLWRNQVPHLPVMPLPEAIHRRFIQLAEEVDDPVEMDGTGATPRKVSSPSALERLQFALLRDGPRLPGGRLVGMETAPVEPWPHQEVVVRRLVETWPYSYLLCDEVGLGKTIEAGLAFRSLHLSGMAKRILIAPPASLTQQWQRQMASKMLLSFARVKTGPGTRHHYIFPDEEERAADSIYQPDRVIVSRDLLARRREELRDCDSFDIALVDEAHAARRKNPGRGVDAHPDYGNLYTTLRNDLRDQTRSLWLATATPMQIDPVEVCDLLALTNRVGPFQYDPFLILQFYEILSKLVHDRNPEKEEWKFLKRAVQLVEIQDPILWDFLENRVKDGRMKTPLDRWLNRGHNPRGRDRKRVLRFIFGAAPLSRVMMRHTRQLLEVYRENGHLKENLARRHIRLESLSFTPLERRIYDQLEDYCNGLARQIGEHGDSRMKQMVSFLLSFLRLRFASSLYAFRETLERRLARVEATLHHQEEPEETSWELSSLKDWVFEGEEEGEPDHIGSILKHRSPADLKWERERLQSMLREMANLTDPSSKMQKLLEVLDQRRRGQGSRFRQTVIFTRFYDTLKDIVGRLQVSQMRIGTYSGQGAAFFDPIKQRMLSVEREQVKERFLREEIDVLVCTDAAAEGLNLQTADLLVNFDLGWNPMKIEQRIGRIDRIGQKHSDIYVLNLCYIGSEEEVVYGRLLSRLQEANLIVGSQPFSLLPVEPEDFRNLAEGTLKPDELERRAFERMEKVRQQTESMEMDPKALYDIYMRMARMNPRDVPVNLTGIWEALSRSQYLRELGCSVSKASGKPILKISGVEGVPDGTILTVSRQLYEEGLPESDQRVHFASYGNQYFDRIVKNMNVFDLPRCVRRITVPVPGMEGVEIVGYAAACRGREGVREIRFIQGWKNLRELQLDEEASLTDAEIEPLRQRLKEIALHEFQSHRSAARIERENIRAARAQELLSLVVIYSLLEDKMIAGGSDSSAGSALREIATLIEQREMEIPVPADPLRSYEEDWLFGCIIPRVGSHARVEVTQTLGRAAVHTANRQLDQTKKGKSKLELRVLMRRLQREIEDRRRQVERLGNPIVFQSPTPQPPQKDQDPDLAWVQWVHPSYQEIAVSLAEAGAPTPEVGFEFMDEGRIVGEAELAWPDRRICVLRSPQRMDAAEIKEMGWRIWDLSSFENEQGDLVKPEGVDWKQLWKNVWEKGDIDA
jgi:superfamily II DNA or RNA helicase